VLKVVGVGGACASRRALAGWLALLLSAATSGALAQSTPPAEAYPAPAAPSGAAYQPAPAPPPRAADQPAPAPPPAAAYQPAAVAEPLTYEPVAEPAPPAGAGVEPGGAPAQSTTEPLSPEVKPVKEAGTHCLLGPFCLGPVLSAGVLDALGFGAQARTDYWGIGIDYQLIGFRANGIPTHLSLLTVEGRLYPMAGAFFLAGGLAWQHATFRGHVVYPGDAQIPPLDTEINGTVSVPVLKLGIGFMGRSGFVMGIDLAFGLQLGRTKVTFQSDLPRIQQVMDVEAKIRKRGDTFVRGLPFLLQLNLIRMGFLF
jgi:hypothetical protein